MRLPPFEPEPWLQAVTTGLNVIIVVACLTLGVLYVVGRLSDDE